MSKRRFQRVALPLLAVLFAVVAIQQLRGLRWDRHPDRHVHVQRVHSERGHAHRHGERRAEHRHRSERHEVRVRMH